MQHLCRLCLLCGFTKAFSYSSTSKWQKGKQIITYRKWVWPRLYPPAAHTGEHLPLSERMIRSVWAWETWPGPPWRPSRAPQLQPLADSTVFTTAPVGVVYLCRYLALTGEGRSFEFLYSPFRNFVFLCCKLSRSVSCEMESVPAEEETSHSKPSPWQIKATGYSYCDHLPTDPASFHRRRVYLGLVLIGRCPTSYRFYLARLCGDSCLCVLQSALPSYPGSHTLNVLCGVHKWFKNKMCLSMKRIKCRLLNREFSLTLPTGYLILTHQNKGIFKPIGNCIWWL